MDRVSRWLAVAGAVAALVGTAQVAAAARESVYGPGCPMCVTGLATIGRARATASRPGVIFRSLSDTLRVPGPRGFDAAPGRAAAT